MKTSDFTFDLPEHLVAQYPPAERGQSRLLVLDRKKRSLEHRMVRDLPSVLEKGTVMVFNNSRVRRARLLGVSEATGAKVEFLLLNKMPENENSGPPLKTGRLWKVMAQRAQRRRPGSRYLFAGGSVGAEIVGSFPQGGASAGGIPLREDGGFRLLKFDRPIDDAWLDIHGHIPLPPYIRRDDGEADGERYQTVYSSMAAGALLGPGASAAAPTAGLHFTEELLAEIEAAGIESVFVTLHVGLGTFLPVRAENVQDHRMHEETYHICEESARRIERARAEGRKILAVGTTSLRTLESAWTEEDDGRGKLRRGEGSTSIFIYPGYTVKTADALFTNFHTPGSTLLMLVSAFAGKDFILESYREAVKEGYRFFSYGDACLIV